MLNIVGWTALDEEGRYGVWSDYMNQGGVADYSQFCNLLDGVGD